MYAKVIIKVKRFTRDVVSHRVVSGSRAHVRKNRRLPCAGSGRRFDEMQGLWLREQEYRWNSRCGNIRGGFHGAFHGKEEQESSK